MKLNYNHVSEFVSDAIMQVIELCYQQDVTTTWKDIYLFLRIPQYIWEDEDDLDEKIIIQNDEELKLMRELLSSRFATKH
jgi:hypothetical protein